MRKSSTLRVLTLIVPALLGCTSIASAQAPSAIVENVKGQVAGVDFMDYVAPGQVIKLGASGSIVLSYLSSCLRETITGGVVVVGTDESRTSLADVNRETILCDKSRTQVPNGTTSGAGMVFRNRVSAAPTYQVTVYALSPVIEVKEQGTLVIERIDRPGERYEAKLAKDTLMKARFHDLAAANTQLKRGGVYAATLGSHRVVFKVDELAEGTGPLLGRLVRL